MSRCVYCDGRGWVMQSHDPDIDIDCPVCGGKAVES